MTCSHNLFAVSAFVSRATSGEDVSFSLFAQAECQECGLPFVFKATPGASPNFPRVSTDGSTLQAPMEMHPDHAEYAALIADAKADD